MTRTIDEWLKLEPFKIVYTKSKMEIYFILQDAKTDIFELYEENKRLKDEQFPR